MSRSVDHVGWADLALFSDFMQMLFEVPLGTVQYECTCIGAFTAILIRTFFVSFRSLVGRNTQSHPLNWAVITEHKFTYDACHYYSWTLIHESLYDIRIQNGFKSMIYGFPRIQNSDIRIQTDMIPDTLIHIHIDPQA